MADKVYETETITVGEGNDAFDAVIKTNTIARQRRFMDQWDKNAQEVEDKRNAFEEAEKEAKEKGEDFDESFDVDPFDGYINLCGIALEKVLENHVDTMYDSKRRLTKQYREFLEENLDDKTVFKVIEVCGGINLLGMMEAVQDIQSQIPATQEAVVEEALSGPN